jgi:hypothetical protein
MKKIEKPYLLLKEEEFKEGCQTTFCRALSGLSDAYRVYGYWS